MCVQVIPVMLVGVLLHKKTYPRVEYLEAIAISVHPAARAARSGLCAPCSLAKLLMYQGPHRKCARACAQAGVAFFMMTEQKPKDGATQASRENDICAETCTFASILR